MKKLLLKIREKIYSLEQRLLCVEGTPEAAQSVVSAAKEAKKAAEEFLEADQKWEKATEQFAELKKRVATLTKAVSQTSLKDKKLESTMKSLASDLESLQISLDNLKLASADVKQRTFDQIKTILDAFAKGGKVETMKTALTEADKATVSQQELEEFFAKFSINKSKATELYSDNGFMEFMVGRNGLKDTIYRIEKGIEKPEEIKKQVLNKLKDGLEKSIGIKGHEKMMDEIKILKKAKGLNIDKDLKANIFKIVAAKSEVLESGGAIKIGETPITQTMVENIVAKELGIKAENLSLKTKIQPTDLEDRIKLVVDDINVAQRFLREIPAAMKKKLPKEYKTTDEIQTRIQEIEKQAKNNPGIFDILFPPKGKERDWSTILDVVVDRVILAFGLAQAGDYKTAFYSLQGYSQSQCVELNQLSERMESQAIMKKIQNDLKTGKMIEKRLRSNSLNYLARLINNPRIKFMEPEKIEKKKKGKTDLLAKFGLSPQKMLGDAWGYVKKFQKYLPFKQRAVTREDVSTAARVLMAKKLSEMSLVELKTNQGYVKLMHGKSEGKEFLNPINTKLAAQEVRVDIADTSGELIFTKILSTGKKAQMKLREWKDNEYGAGPVDFSNVGKRMENREKGERFQEVFKRGLDGYRQEISKLVPGGITVELGKDVGAFLEKCGVIIDHRGVTLAKKSYTIEKNIKNSVLPHIKKLLNPLRSSPVLETFQKKKYTLNELWQIKEADIKKIDANLLKNDQFKKIADLLDGKKVLEYFLKSNDTNIKKGAKDFIIALSEFKGSGQYEMKSEITKRGMTFFTASPEIRNNIPGATGKVLAIGIENGTDVIIVTKKSEKYNKFIWNANKFEENTTRLKDNPFDDYVSFDQNRPSA